MSRDFLYSTSRLAPKIQTLNEAYSPPADFLEIQVSNPQTKELPGSSKRYTEYDIVTKTNLPIFEKSKSLVRRRYSDFQWLKHEIDRAVKINIPELPEQGIFKQIPFIQKDDGIFEEEFIRERQAGLEEFINRIACHPLVQSEKCLHLFLQSDFLDKKNYVPSKITHSQP